MNDSDQIYYSEVSDNLIDQYGPDDTSAYFHDADQPGPSVTEEKRPRIKRDYTEQKKQTVRIRKALDEGTMLRITKSIQPPKAGQLGMIFRRLKKSEALLKQLPEVVQEEEIGQISLKQEQEANLIKTRNDPEALESIFSGLVLDTGRRQEIGDFDDEDLITREKKVIPDRLGKYQIRPPGFDLKHIQGITAEEVRGSDEYQKEREIFEITTMLHQVHADQIQREHCIAALKLIKKKLLKTIFEEPEDGCTETCARIRPVVRIFKRPKIDLIQSESKSDLSRNIPGFDRYTLDCEIREEALGLYELHRIGMAHPAFEKAKMNARSLQRQQVGLEKEKPKTSVKLTKREKLMSSEEPKTTAEPMKMVIRRVPSHPVNKRPRNPNYKISKDIQHPPSQPIIAKKKPRKVGIRSQFKDWD